MYLKIKHPNIAKATPIERLTTVNNKKFPNIERGEYIVNSL